MPRLQALYVYCSDVESSRDAICGNGSMDHFEDTNEQLVEVAKLYVAPELCQRLPMLIIPGAGKTLVGKKVDMPWRQDGRTRLMYVNQKA